MINKLLFAFLTIFIFVGSAMALDVPQYRGRVNDFAGILAPDQVRNLEKKLEQYEKETSNQIAILTITSLEEDSLEDFSIRVVENWKIGHKGKDNGVLILVVFKDRKMRIEVGRGLEGSLTDLTAGRIVTDVMAPAFKQKDYNKGINDAIDAIGLAVKGEFEADAIKKDNSDDKFGLYLIFLAITLIIAGVVGMILHPIAGGIAGGAGTFLATLLLLNPVISLLVAITVIGFVVGLIAHFIVQFMPDLLCLVISGESGGSTSTFGGGDFGGGGASGGWD